MNPSTQRAVPGIQAGRERETNEGDKGRHMNPSTQRVNLSTQASRLGDNGRQMKGDKGRQMNPSRARHPGWETNEGRQRETNEPVHPESRARHPGWETTGDK